MAGWLPVILGGGLLAAALTVGSTGGGPVGSSSEERKRLWSMTAAIEASGALPGFQKFADAKGYWESRYVPTAARGTSTYGWLQLAPTSAFTKGNDLVGTSGQASKLRTREWHLPLAADYYARGIRAAQRKGRTPDMLAMARWWKYPELIHDVDEDNPISVGIRERFAKALKATGHSSSFMHQPAMLGNYTNVQDNLARFGVSA